MPDFAEMPQFDIANANVVFGFDVNQLDNVGGTTATLAPGGRLIQAPGLTLPMLWNRGSLFNLGIFGLAQAAPGLLPALGSSQFDASGVFSGTYWWDSPNSWGRAGFLPRRPRTLIIVDYIGLSGLATTITANYASIFAPVNVSVCLFFNAGQTGGRGWGASWLATGIPFTGTQTSTVFTATDNLEQITYSTPTAMPNEFSGGDCLVALLMPNIMNAQGPNAVGGYCGAVATNTPGASLITPSGFTLYQTTAVNQDPPPANAQIGLLVNTSKAQSDGLILQDGAARFKTFQLIAYQYDLNPGSSAWFNVFGAGFTRPPYGADPFMPDSAADTLIGFGGSFASRQTFTNGDSASLIAQLLTDATNFFPPLP